MAIVTTAGLVDRSNWGSGPWDNEPDLEYWLDEATVYPCLAVRGPVGAWCGYVGVLPGHPLHRSGYYDADSVLAASVHGGLSFSGELTSPEVMARPELHNVWWFGFDCSHYSDMVPWTLARVTDSLLVYRTLEYVRAECASLAWELDGVEGRADVLPGMSAPAQEAPKIAEAPVLLLKRKIRIRRG